MKKSQELIKTTWSRFLEDYNQEFDTHFTMSDLRGFNTDVNNRLARKQDKYLYRNEQLDLVIVVNRLLTGFDAPLSIDSLYRPKTHATAGLDSGF